MTDTVFPSLKDKRVIVTGGGSGIGAALVRAFVLQGAEVHFLDIKVADSKALVADLSAAPKPPVFIPCDLTDVAAIRRTFEAIGPIDVLVNNAASDDRHSLAAITPDYWQERMNVNLRHLLFCTQAAAPGMKARGGGAVINFGSISWHLGLADLVLYETAKAGIEGMTRALARELGTDNIRVTAIVPGNVRTPRQMQWYTPEGESEIIAQQCLKVRLEPEHIAPLVLFLASDDGRFCTGHEYWIDAGWR